MGGLLANCKSNAKFRLRSLVYCWYPVFDSNQIMPVDRNLDFWLSVVKDSYMIL